MGWPIPQIWGCSRRRKDSGRNKAVVVELIEGVWSSRHSFIHHYHHHHQLKTPYQSEHLYKEHGHHFNFLSGSNLGERLEIYDSLASGVKGKVTKEEVCYGFRGFNEAGNISAGNLPKCETLVPRWRLERKITVYMWGAWMNGRTGLNYRICSMRQSYYLDSRIPFVAYSYQLLMSSCQTDGWMS